jgi:uncharacterized membrane protein YhaH (DUF805 family)
MNYYLNVWKNFATFSGRARRSEYWMFFLFNTIVSMVLVMVDMALGTVFLLAGLYGLAAFIPGLAVTVRRLHDTGKSGLWFLISFVPLIGFIAFLVFMFQDSQVGDNEYGPNPKMVSSFA